MLSDDMVKRLIDVFGHQAHSWHDKDVTYAERDDRGCLWWNDLFQPYEREYAEQERGLVLYAYLDFTGVARDDSDSCGQARTWVRSNLRAIKAAYPNVFTPLHYVGSECLGAFLIDLDDDIAEMLIGLAENYPLFDEGDVSALEQEDMDASWSQWVSSDLYRGLNGGAENDWHALPAETVEQLFWDIVHVQHEQGPGDRPMYHDGLEIHVDFDAILPWFAQAVRSTARKMRRRGLLT